jgi:hypothetical protein
MKRTFRVIDTYEVDLDLDGTPSTELLKEIMNRAVRNLGCKRTVEEICTGMYYSEVDWEADCFIKDEQAIYKDLFSNEEDE